MPEDPHDPPTEGLRTQSLGRTDAAGREMIGDFRIIRELGRGGMGVVFEAEQQNPRRPVALKVIRGGRFVDDNAIKMFQREAQTLARLKHPGIAAIYESGRTEDGQHFFAMELVRGETLTQWISERPKELTRDEIRVRIGVVRRICEAVGYAHQRGVIHRDIKPSNVVVLREAVSSDSSLSGVPDVKVLDFGLARITDTDVAASTQLTEAGVMQGTLRYMSPEQIRANPDEIDSRTDVYSLGVLLYELLTGQLPFQFEGHSVVDIARIICDQPPAHLSKNWPASKRPGRDLETIVGKALEKNAADRYQSVTALSEDLKRYLAQQPILARQPSAVYQLRKMIGRHTIGFAFAASVVVLIVALAVTMTIQAGRIARERDRANQEAETAEQVSEFLADLFTVSDPSEALGNKITAREILDRGADEIRDELSDQPGVQGRLMNTMGRVYRTLGLSVTARPLVEEALEIQIRELGEEHVDVARTRANLALILVVAGEFEAAMASFEKALATLDTELGSDDRDVATVENDMASALLAMGKFEESRALYVSALEKRERILGPDHEDVAGTLVNLSMALRKLERYEEALPLARRAVRILEDTLEDNHPDLLESLNNLGNLYYRLGDYEAALPLYERMLRVREEVYDPDHPRVASGLNNLASLHWAMKNFEAALPLYERALRIREAAHGDDHWRTARAMNNLADTLKELGEYEQARSLFKRSLAIREETFEPDHPEIASSYGSFAGLLVKTGEYARAREYYERALRILENKRGTDSPLVAHAMVGLATLSVAIRDYPSAWPYYERALRIREDKLPAGHPDTSRLLYEMGRLGAIEGDGQRSLGFLRQAMSHGYKDRELLEDDAFADLRGDREFDALVDQLRQRLGGG